MLHYIFMNNDKKAVFVKRILRVGGSLGIYIPTDVIRYLDLKHGDFVEVRLRKISEKDANK